MMFSLPTNRDVFLISFSATERFQGHFIPGYKVGPEPIVINGVIITPGGRVIILLNSW